MIKKREPRRKKVDVPIDFVHWWEPWGNDKDTGASIGGHPDALRMWARPEPEGGYTRRMYGTKTKIAWLTRHYQDQYEEWRELGCPAREDFISMAAPLEKLREFWTEIAPFVAMIGKDERTKEKIRTEYNTEELLPKLLEKYKIA